MKKRFSMGTVLALMLLVAAVTYLISYTMAQNQLNSKLDGLGKQEEETKKFLKAKQLIEKNFVGEWDEEKLIDGAIDGMVASLGDTWSQYLNADDYRTYTDDSNKYVGIGVTVTFDSGTGYIKIAVVYNGSPAQEAGIQPLDTLIAVNGEDISELGYYAAIDKIRGEEYSTVKLTLMRGTREYTADVMRRVVNVELVHSEILDGNVGYIRVRSFDSRADVDFSESVNRLINANVEGIIVDMRYNPGGSLPVLLPMLDMLLPEGGLITMRQKDGAEIVHESDDKWVDIPMVVLVNSDSYSAAEFFAACLQEYGRAKIVGEATTGKGYAQVHMALDDGSGLILSTQEYFTPNGISLAGIGIKPDVNVNIDDSERQSFYEPVHEGDRQLEKAKQVLSETVKEQENQELDIPA